MAEGTRISKLDETVSQLKDTSIQHGQLMSNLQETTARQNQHLNDLYHKIIAMDMNNKREESHHTTSNNYIQTQTIRLDFPRFDGSNPAGWIYMAEQLFSYHQTRIEQRLMNASFHLEENAL
ncbi:hypothetical protein AMTRI_Chr13g122980 [Amborella trichopoda]